ncbi:MAG TPA: CDP-archaeol synthase [Stellaceae bacterium]|nr:CDP-archaeol synthase [Stellaceae bacterium]
MHPLTILQVMILLTLANGTPVIAKRILGDRFAYPLDGGALFLDGRPLLGRSKTARGIVLSILATSLGAPLVGLAASVGFLVGSIAMAGDLFSSFLKRRFDLPSSSRATGLDQIPESLFPLLACRVTLPLTLGDVAVAVAIFFLGEVVLSRLLYKLRIRDRPY